MEPLNTHKALGHTIFLFGFRPLDFFVVIVCPALIALSVGYVLGIVCFIAFWYAAKKLKHRPPGYFSSVFLFLATPDKLAVKPYADIPSYAKSINNVNQS